MSGSGPVQEVGILLDADGTHTVEATEVKANGSAALTQAFTVSNAGVTTPIRALINAPDRNATLSGNYLVSGWAIDEFSAIASVAISVDGLPQGFAN